MQFNEPETLSGKGHTLNYPRKVPTAVRAGDGLGLFLGGNEAGPRFRTVGGYSMQHQDSLHLALNWDVRLVQSGSGASLRVTHDQQRLDVFGGRLIQVWNISRPAMVHAGSD